MIKLLLLRISLTVIYPKQKNSFPIKEVVFYDETKHCAQENARVDFASSSPIKQIVVTLKVHNLSLKKASQ